MKVWGGLICIIHGVSSSTLGGGEGAHLHHPQCASPLSWAEVREGLICIFQSVSPSTFSEGGEWDYFASSTVCLPLPWVKIGEGLSSIIHGVSPSILYGVEGDAHLHHLRVSFNLR